MDLAMEKLRALAKGKQESPLTAVAAYEDAITEARVHEFCRNLARSLGNDCQISKQMWLLSELRVGGLRAIAATLDCPVPPFVEALESQQPV